MKDCKYGKGPGKDGRKGDTFHPKPASKSRGKDTPDSKGPGPDDFMKGMKKPKGGGK